MNLDSSLTNLAGATFDFLFASVECEKSKDLIVGVIYRPPNTDVQIFIKELSQMLTKL